MLCLIKNHVLGFESHFLKQFPSFFYCTVHNIDIEKNNNIEILNKTSTKSLKVALVGLPNSGKSTLVNQLTRRWSCPTSCKVHTTLHKAEHVFTKDDTQIVFLDTPGLVTNREVKTYKLAKTFQNDPVSSIKEADVVGIMQDVTNVYTRHKLTYDIIKYVENRTADSSLLLIFNKVDKLKNKSVLLSLVDQLQKSTDTLKFDDIFMVSALNGDGVDDLRNYLLDSAKTKTWAYDKDYYTNQAHETIIKQTIRAKLMDFLPHQVPYMITQDIEHIDYGENGRIQCSVILNCTKSSFVRMLLKRKGETVKMIAVHVERELRSAFRTEVYVRLIVKYVEEKK